MEDKKKIRGTMSQNQGRARLKESEPQRQILWYNRLKKNCLPVELMRAKQSMSKNFLFST